MQANHSPAKHASLRCSRSPRCRDISDAPFEDTPRCDFVPFRYRLIEATSHECFSSTPPDSSAARCLLHLVPHFARLKIVGNTSCASHAGRYQPTSDR